MLHNNTLKKITFSKNYWSNSFIEKHKLRREVCNLVCRVLAIVESKKREETRLTVSTNFLC